MEHIAAQTPTTDDQLFIYEKLMKQVDGTEPRNVCAVCCVVLDLTAISKL